MDDDRAEGATQPCEEASPNQRQSLQEQLQAATAEIARLRGELLAAQPQTQPPPRPQEPQEGDAGSDLAAGSVPTAESEAAQVQPAAEGGSDSEADAASVDSLGAWRCMSPARNPSGSPARPAEQPASPASSGGGTAAGAAQRAASPAGNNDAARRAEHAAPEVNSSLSRAQSALTASRMG